MSKVSVLGSAFKNCSSIIYKSVPLPRPLFLANHQRFTSLFKYHIMEESTLTPPASVRGMKILKKELFRREIDVPCLMLPVEHINKIKPILKPYIIKLQAFKPIRDLSGDDSSLIIPPGVVKDNFAQARVAVLSPKFTTFSNLKVEDQGKLETLGITKLNLINARLVLDYDNWRADEVLRAIVPEEFDSVSSYSICGHIVHLNLRDCLEEYKSIIGDVILEKVKQAKTVVNKVDIIDSTYRTFKMELLCGEEEFITTVKENKCQFTFDFSKVYWNPRLSTEHDRVVSLMTPGDVLYDVFCGVGPFVIPAQKKGCRVLANDLNPESVKWLRESAKKNKVNGIEIYNKDGKDFIQEDIKKDLLKLPCNFRGNIHIVMNLPGMASSFLPTFRGLFTDEELVHISKLPVPRVYVFCFTKGEEDPQSASKRLIEDNLGLELGSDLLNISFVRNVAPLKEMMRVTILLSKRLLTLDKRKSDEPALHVAKKLCP